ncbi:MAG: ATP-dependent Clp protease adapter ClpS [Deltaproteobacteria bacterium]|nr:ATP-dependent Clp protease adapter ClpS [Deltaproteobacteria bacterium]
MGKQKTEGGVDTVTRDDTKIHKPKLYKVFLINDDYTTMDFVVSVLESIFKKSPAEALQIMLHVHQRGQGLCGVYPREIAEAKVHQVHERARAEGHPLRCQMNEE